MSEKTLCALWRQQRWIHLPLSTACGRALQVVYPGRHTFDHGPDFRDAIFALDDDLLHGDVEIHVRTGDWRGHRHQADPFYDRVALHVVWHDDGSAALTPAGRLLPVLALRRHVALDEFARVQKEGPVEEQLHFAGFGPPCRNHGSPVAVLAKLGEERLAGKAAVFEGTLAIQDPAQVFYAALLDALGFSTNREPCRRLAENLPWQLLASASTGVDGAARVKLFEALLLGSAGLLVCPRSASQSAGDHDYRESLDQRWQQLNRFWRITPLARRDWRFARVRPENFPPRRLAAAAHLLAPYARSDLPAAFLGVLRSEGIETVCTALEEALSVPAQGYWATHYDLGRPAKLPSQLLGHARAADIAINVVLPFAVAYAEQSDDPHLADRARSAHLAYPPLSDNELTRYTARLVFARSRPRGLHACHQQGLLQAYHRYCREKRCYECPLGANP